MAEGSSGRRRSIDDDDYDDDEERAKEVKELQQRGILPNDFPSSSDDPTKYDSDDACDEIEKLLELGAISPQVAKNLKQKQAEDHEQIEEMSQVSDREVASREQVIPPFRSDGIPLNWNSDVNPKSRYTLVPLKKGEPEFDMISEEFDGVNLKIKKIERLQNERLLNRFKAEMEEVAQHREQGFDLNTRYLYHGTNVDKARLCEEGLDQRLSRMGFFGKGIYFSDNPIKCVHYSEHSKTPDEASILKCRVILGESKAFTEGHYDITLKREPEKENPGDGWRYYDSVMGCPKDYNEYVVYENRRAMIEYIISFKVDDKTASKIKRQSNGPGEAANGPSGDAGVSGVEVDHLQRICDVREAVRRKRIKERGSSYDQPSQSQLKFDSKMWSKLKKMHGVDADTECRHGDMAEWEEAVGETPLTPSDVTLTDTTAHRGRDRFATRDATKTDTTTHRGHDWSTGSGWSPPTSNRTPPSSDRTPSTSGWSPPTSNRTPPSSDRTSPTSGWTPPTWTPPAPWKSASGRNPPAQQDVIDLTLDSSSPAPTDNPVEQVLHVCVAEFKAITNVEDTALAKFYIQKAQMDVNQAISLYYEDCG